jgi:hypothetical protein
MFWAVMLSSASRIFSDTCTSLIGGDDASEVTSFVVRRQ